ncbi:MAG TPA: YafY family protein [Edaphobacter sp.]|nr:YafY family protein [Edaphobacter sp.]
MKSDRLLSALMLLQAKGRVTSRELSDRLEVSQRTVHRDMEALSAANVPISALRGAQGGWQLEQGWRTQVPGLDEAELRALLMTQPRALSDPAMRAASERAFGKLMAALPGRMREQAAAMSERLHIDPTGWHASSEDLSVLPIVQDAVARNCKLTFDYTRADGESAPRTVDPLGIVSKGMAWYLVARAPNGMRTYRVSRMKAVTPLASNFERPANFKLAVYWESSTKQLAEQRKYFDAVVAADLKAAQSLRNWCVTTPYTDKHPKSILKDWEVLNIRFEDPEQGRFIVLGFGPRTKVLEPASFRKQILADANAVLNSAKE